MYKFFGPGGLIARQHPKYEFRPGQIDMAEAVRQTLEKGGHLLVEAGTGTGKSLAYLIPALQCKERVIISTGTKNLQEQLFYKDVPFLERALGRQLNVTYMKGRNNYVCLHRLKQAQHSPVLQGLDQVDHFEKVYDWAFKTHTGDRAELNDLPETLGFWSSVDARSEICLGQKCPDYEPCFITRMRERAASADIVIVNHHLFFADLVLRGREYGSILPEYRIVIFDEAHELEEIASDYFGAECSNYRLLELVRDASSAAWPDTKVATEVANLSSRLQQRAEQFWMHFQPALDLEREFPARARMRAGAARTWDREGRYALDPSRFVTRDGSGEPTQTPAGKSLSTLIGALERLEHGLSGIKDAPPEAETLARRSAQARADLTFIGSCSDSRFVYWFERRGRGTFLQATPIEMSEILGEALFESVYASVLTSATMTSEESFAFIRGRLGIVKARELIVPSPFEYARQAILYLPRGMPDPRSLEFLDAVVGQTIEILKRTEGRAFVLFTSIAQMREAYERVRKLVSFPCFLQGEGSKSGLLDRFRTTPHAVLFATSSFWQGVDVQGEALSCVIVDKLPFAVPSDPVVAARQRYLEERGVNAFLEYSVPHAVLMLKQGLGRLIRSREDVGVLSVLDPRIRTKGYGAVFLKSLPPCPVTHQLDDIARIFVRHSAAPPRESRDE
ncbi:MAG: ATP-dependent DNA helicase [Acidobacteria bacterium]|nr:ATP-dependent DNA helicase [Acidobacteriota bacterium]